eukprot:gene9640-11817_t
MKEEKISRKLNCSCTEFLEIYKDQNSQTEYHLKRGDINLVFTEWQLSNTTTTSNNEERLERTITFQAPINAPQSITKLIGKDATTITEIQKYNFNRLEKSIHINTFYKPDIMGDYFSVETEWFIKGIDGDHCILDLVIRVNFNMRFVGNIFEGFIIKAASQSAIQYVDIVDDILKKFKLLQLKQRDKELKDKEKEKEKELLQQQQQQQQQQIILQKQQQQQQQQKYLNNKFEIVEINNHKNQNNNKLKSKLNNQSTKKKNFKNNNNNFNNDESYSNWNVNCKLDEIENNLSDDLKILQEFTQNASQSLLKIEISLSEMNV